MCGSPPAKKPVWLFKEMIWPAVAGNVAWSFFTMVISPGVWSEDGSVWRTAGDWWARLLTLGILSAYVVFDYISTREKSDRLPDRFLFWDPLHSASIIVYALALAANKGWTAWALAAVFLVGAVGHGFGAWVDKDKPDKCKRWLLMAVNGLGLVGALLVLQRPWREVFVVGLITGIWWAVSFRMKGAS